MVTLREALDRFIQYLGSERNMAPRTVEAYRYDLLRFVDYIEGKEDKIRRIDRVDDYDLKDYIATLKEEHDCRPATLCRVISSMRVFFRYAAEEGFIDLSPAARLHNPRKPKKLPVFLTQGEAGGLLAHQDVEDGMGLRNRTMLFLLMMTGIRLSELVDVDLEDVDFDQGTVKVLGKGRKERLVPMNKGLQRVLREWLTARPPAECRALFLDRNGDRITPRMVQYAVRKAVKALGLDPRISPHKLRHTFATNLYAEDVDLRDIQELLGHANISSTSIYTHTNVDKVRAAVETLKALPKPPAN